jgi:uncharacterized membrane protein YfcA
MSFYLPVAEMSANILVFLAMGGAVGFLSGMFGVGGGFLMTPLLIFAGIPAAVAVGTGAAQILAASVSGALAQWRRRNVDVKMGSVLLMGGLAGSMMGVEMVRLLRRHGLFDFFLAACYVTFLGVIGIMMLIESTNTIRQCAPEGGASPPFGPAQLGARTALQDALPPLPALHRAIRRCCSACSWSAGGHHGRRRRFILVPAMIYLLRMPTNVVIGTSLFQFVFLTAATTVLQASVNYNVDVILAVILMVGGVVGAQFGAAAGQRLKGEELRFLLATFILFVCARFAWQLIARPAELYSIGAMEAI